MTTAHGLEGICVADTHLSDVRGERGELIIAGSDVEALAKSTDFAGAVARLWNAAGLGDLTRDEVARRLGLARAAAPKLAVSFEGGMDALRASVAQLNVSSDPLDAAFSVLGATATLAASWYSKAAVTPDASADHASDLLRMMCGTSDPARARALDHYLVTVMEHGMNASTFAVRVVASTGSDVVSAVVAGIGALKGPLHGGAPGPVLDMLDAVANEDAASWIDRELTAGRRIMGIGHRVYRTRDPRAAVLEHTISELGGNSARLAHARRVEQAARTALKAKYPGRSLDTNVEFYTAVLLDAIGIDRRAFSPLFAVARTAGWLAHFNEERRTGRLIRPDARYVGR